jgi:serine phosphatase RsbU (regulator of sigma subunit)
VPVTPDLTGHERLALSDVALFETLILEAPVAFAFYDTDLRYRRINRLLADINALSMEAHIGRRPTEILPDPIGRAVEARLLEVLETGAVVSDDDFTAASPLTGELGHYESKWYPARAADGSIIGVAVLISDVTERHRSDEALLRSNERTVRLQQATAALAGALTVDDVRRVLRDLGRSAGFATHIEIELREGEAAPVEPLSPLLPDPGMPPGIVALPLVVSGGRIGTLRLTRRASEVAAEDRAFLGALAGQCAIALERARLYERERYTAVALQRSLLPDRLPDAAGVELAARFLPGSAESDVGGDWYDAFSLPDGRLVLVVGDVMGKGVAAAAGMGRLRAALRALALVNPLPEAVLTGLDRVFTATEDADQIATLVYLLINPTARRAAVGGAGHLPLVLVRAGHEPELIDAGSGSTPLGWSEPRGQRTLELGPGDLLLGLTDGVVERRGFDLDEGLRELVACVGRAQGSLDDLVERVTTTMLGHTKGRDDATLLAVRFVS